MDRKKGDLDKYEEIITLKKIDQGIFHAELAELYRSRADRFMMFAADYDSAIYEYKKAISLDPGEPEYYARLAIVLCKKDKIAEAIDNLKKAIDLDPDEVRYKIYFAQALIKWGTCYDDSRFHARLGDVCERLELFDLAKTEHERSARGVPGS